MRDRIQEVGLVTLVINGNMSKVSKSEGGVGKVGKLKGKLRKPKQVSEGEVEGGELGKVEVNKVSNKEYKNRQR